MSGPEHATIDDSDETKPQGRLFARHPQEREQPGPPAHQGAAEDAPTPGSRSYEVPAGADSNAAAPIVSHWAEPMPKPPQPGGSGTASSQPGSGTVCTPPQLTPERQALDHTIRTDTNLDVVRKSFQKFWQIDLTSDKAAGPWDLPTIRAIHEQLLLLPHAFDKKSQARKINRSHIAGGSFSEGSQINIGRDTVPYTKLAKDAESGQPILIVEDAHLFNSGDMISIGSDDKQSYRIKTVPATNQLELDSSLTSKIKNGTQVYPSLAAVKSTTLKVPAAANSSTIEVKDPSCFSLFTTIELESKSNKETRRISLIKDNKYILDTSLTKNFPASKIDVTTVKGVHNRSDTTPFFSRTQLTQPAAAGDKHIVVSDLSQLHAYSWVNIGADAQQDSVQIERLDPEHHTAYLRGPLKHPHQPDEMVTLRDQRDTNTLSQMVRHELGHAVEKKVSAKGFIDDLGGWKRSNDVDEWIKDMGQDAWNLSSGGQPQVNAGANTNASSNTSSNASIPMAEIKHAIKDAVKSADAKSLMKFSGYRVVDLAIHCINSHTDFYSDPSQLKPMQKRSFSINLLNEEKFQSCNEIVYDSRVSNYSLFAPAEFFAEAYTVFYEEAGHCCDEELGRLLPVRAWRDWFYDNVHKRGLHPNSGKDSKH